MNALPALMAARRLGLPFVYEVRGFWEITQVSRDPAFLHSVRYNNAVELETLTAQKADRVMTLNQPMAEELVRRGVARDKIVLIPNACDPAKYAPRNRDPDLARRLGIDLQTPVIGFVGSFTIYEGLDDLVLACGILRKRGLDFKLVLVGDEVIYNKLQRPLMPHLRALVAREQLEDHVHFAGRVASADVPQWYSLIDIAPFARKALAVSELVPPLKPLEAMAMSKTVVASDVGALQDFILHGQTGLMFPKGDIGALADMLERVLRDVALRQALGASARDWVVAQRSWATVAQNLHRAMKDLG
jgi:glycosyltransferase involved in cell wall biosynthesis